MKTIEAYEILKHGQFLPREAPSVPGDEWACVATGNGLTERGAFEDAALTLQDQGFDVDPLQGEWSQMNVDEATGGRFFFVSIRVS